MLKILCKLVSGVSCFQNKYMLCTHTYILNLFKMYDFAEIESDILYCKNVIFTEKTTVLCYCDDSLSLCVTPCIVSTVFIHFMDSPLMIHYVVR